MNHGKMACACVYSDFEPNAPDTPIVALMVTRLGLAPSHTSRLVLKMERMNGFEHNCQDKLAFQGPITCEVGANNII